MGMTPDIVWSQLGTADAPVLIDVRTDEDFDADPALIPTASRVPHLDLATCPLPSAPCVVVCHKGLKLSMGGAALLSARGAKATWLTGGSVAWRASALPRTPANTLPASARWVITDQPDPRAITAAWLVRRFVQPDTTFLAVPADAADAVADRFGATQILPPEQDLKAFAGHLGLTHPDITKLIAKVTASGEIHDLLRAAIQRPTLQALDSATPILDALRQQIGATA